MLNFPWLPQRNDLCRQMANIGRLNQERRFDEALEATKEAEAACIASGVTASPFLLWSMAAAHDNVGNLLEGLVYILKAVRLDPVDYSINHSLDLVAGRVRSRLLGFEWDDEAAEMYRRLGEEELTDDALRVAFAAYLLGNEKYVEALRVAQAVALLNPRNAKAWCIIESAAVKLGDTSLAVEAANSSAAAKVSSQDLKPNVGMAQA